MARRRREPEEAFGPMLDGTRDVASLAEYLIREPAEELDAIEEKAEPETDPQVLVICGEGETALAVARLGRECDFEVAVVRDSEPGAGDELAEMADSVHVLEGYDRFVESCGVDHNHYVCCFGNDAKTCEHILNQCLHSDAAYIGLGAEKEMAREIFAELRDKGAPDAELAAICSPMGLYIGAKTPTQQAVAIVAETLAARAGVLKRLRFKK